eukprot:TRINITY_DN2730_c0_g1_i10.p1 TRINITY_DN2730_c0_g1~~TRINITY_DN2730_c0_g1_i10.p1  ORF type:complete len:180 (-),score=30.51 TRINITY_DN2730_c0_g1_i10:508-1047(-)
MYNSYQNEENVVQSETPVGQRLCEVRNGTPSLSALFNTKSIQLQATPKTVLTKTRHEEEEEELESLFGVCMVEQEKLRKMTEQSTIDQKVKQMHVYLEKQQGVPKFARYVAGIMFSPCVDPFGEKFCKFYESVELLKESEEEHIKTTNYSQPYECSSGQWDYMNVDEMDLVSSLPVIQV